MSVLTRFWLWAGLIVVMCGGASCQYRLGSGAQPQFETIALQPVLNKTALPQIEPLLDAQLREQLLRSGARIVEKSSADATLQVVLTQYDHDLASVRSDDSGLALSYGMKLKAEVTLIKADGTVLLNAVPVEIRREPLVEEGIQVAEYQTLPVIARDLAQRIRRRVLDTW